MGHNACTNVLPHDSFEKTNKQTNKTKTKLCQREAP